MGYHAKHYRVDLMFSDGQMVRISLGLYECLLHVNIQG